MKRLPLFLVLISGLLLTACGAPEDFYPLAVGNKWEMDYSSSTTTTTFQPTESTSTIGPMTGQWAIEITGTEKMASGEDVFVLSPTGSTGSQVRYARKDDSSLYLYASTSDTTPVYSEPLHLEVGATWSNTVMGYTTTYKVEERGVSVTVPAGTFTDCVAISTTTSAPDSPTIMEYRANGVGTVKMTLHSQTELTGVMRIVSDFESVLTRFTH